MRGNKRKTRPEEGLIRMAYFVILDKGKAWDVSGRSCGPRFNPLLYLPTHLSVHFVCPLSSSVSLRFNIFCQLIVRRLP